MIVTFVISSGFWVLGFWDIGDIDVKSCPVLSLDMMDADEPHQDSQINKGSIRTAHQEELLLV